MPKRFLCKFFAHGACLKGEHCEFSHDWKAPPNNICTFYQKGICAYASRCRYEHVKVSRLQSSVSSSAADPSLPSSFHVECPPGTATYEADMFTVPPSLPSSFPVEWAPGTATYEADMSTVPPSLPSSFPVEWSPGIATYEADMPTATNGQFNPPNRPAWGENSGHHNVLESDDDFGYLRSVDPAGDQSICSFAAAGDCPRGNKCPHIHGDLCPTCGKHCLHPFRPLEREEHMKTCEKRQKHLEALRHSQEIECSVCLERVLSKTKSAERKFGILSECNHPFCISCIRNWRGSSPASGLDVNSALRACPICRKLSYFVIPSVIWYSSKEEKQEIVDSYKAKLKSIDCKHFDFGNGTCPFGTSCFYKHSYRDGSLEEVVLRHLGAEDGNTVIAKNIRLSDFLRNLQIR